MLILWKGRKKGEGNIDVNEIEYSPGSRNDEEVVLTGDTRKDRRLI